MKKLGYLLFGLALIVALNSCSKEMGNEKDDSELKKSVIAEVTESSPISFNGIIPYLIPGDNKGGNRTCDDVAMAFNTEFALCGEKVDYGDDFSGSFPKGLDVMTDGLYVSFDIDGCLEIDGKNYKVGAVIVKGSDQANVYWYPEGTTSDSKLASPVNSSGLSAQLSNLTFCFVECEMSMDNYIFMKLFYRDAEDSIMYWALLDSPLSYYEVENDWCSHMGINKLIAEQTIDLRMYGDGPVNGFMNIIMDNNMINVQTTMSSGLILHKAYIFVGTMDDLDSYGICPNYNDFPFVIEGDDILSFDIALN
ncbi:MAG: hypothetical protein JW717_03650 [Marinilabiliaceae bacterium]|nr:hypothetical protein [Marinilabiliaceae bacterium]